MVRNKVSKTIRKGKDALAREPVLDSDFIGPSPNPRTNLVLADIALRGGAMLVRQGLERSLLGRKYAPEKASKILKGRSMTETLVGVAIAKLATRSVPGAIVVGGGMLAKTLYERRKGFAAKRQGERDLDAQAEQASRED